jgi:hypothetical protein
MVLQIKRGHPPCSPPELLHDTRHTELEEKRPDKCVKTPATALFDMVVPHQIETEFKDVVVA